MNKVSWYVMFSVVGFYILWKNTKYRLFSIQSSRNSKLSEAYGNVFLSTLLFLVLPLIIVFLIVNNLANDIFYLPLFITLYIGGVVAAHMHDKWRKENGVSYDDYDE